MADLFDRAHARRTDPETSHEAAQAATLGIERQRNLVNAYAKSCGKAGFMDVELEEAHPNESDSGLRTRRSELAARNIILDSGRRERASGSARRRIVWVHRIHVDDPPPEKDAPPNPAMREHLKHEAIDRARLLRSEAEGLKRTYGLAALANFLIQCADLMEELAR